MNLGRGGVGFLYRVSGDLGIGYQVWAQGSAWQDVRYSLSLSYESFAALRRRFARDLHHRIYSIPFFKPPAVYPYTQP